MPVRFMKRHSISLLTLQSIVWMDYLTVLTEALYSHGFFRPLVAMILIALEDASVRSAEISGSPIDPGQKPVGGYFESETLTVGITTALVGSDSE
jgi:hypothetical protein